MSLPNSSFERNKILENHTYDSQNRSVNNCAYDLGGRKFCASKVPQQCFVVGCGGQAKNERRVPVSERRKSVAGDRSSVPRLRHLQEGTVYPLRQFALKAAKHVCCCFSSHCVPGVSYRP